MICALLIFQTPDLPAPLGELSPWLDMPVVPRDQVFAQLAAQQHRRFIKTHTPFDGVPIDPRATYVQTARHPLDMAVSLYHHSANIDRARLRELTGNPSIADRSAARPELHEWLAAWTRSTVAPMEQMDSLPGVMWHVGDAWGRRDQPNIVLLHYSDLERDLDGQMRRLAGRLGIGVDEAVWPQLVDAARFGSMRDRAAELMPERHGVVRIAQEFFRRGGSGAGAEVLTSAEFDSYMQRARALAPDDLVAWLHR